MSDASGPPPPPQPDPSGSQGLLDPAAAVERLGEAGQVAIKGGRAFGLGLACVGRGARRLVVTPRLWPYALVPVLVSLCVFVGGLWWFVASGASWAQDTVTGWMGDVGGLIAGIVAVLVLLAAGLVFFYVAFPSVVRVFSAPLLALLSEKVVADVAGGPPPAFEGGRFTRLVLIPVKDALGLLAFQVAVMILALPLNLIPVLGQFLFFAVLLPIGALDFLDLALSARAVGLRGRIAFVRQNLAATSGFGLGSAGILFLPVVNAFFLPALVVGAVLLDESLSPDFPRHPPAAGDC